MSYLLRCNWVTFFLSIEFNDHEKTVVLITKKNMIFPKQCLFFIHIFLSFFIHILPFDVDN